MKNKLNLMIGKILFSVAFVFAAMCLLTIAAQTAAAQNIPPGSYQQSCANISFSGTTLKATCKDNSTSISVSQISKTAQPNASLDLAHLCGEISNNNGKLVCLNNFGSQAYKIAKAAFNTASMTILGRKPAGEENAGEIPAWIYLTLTKYGSAQNYFAGMKTEAAEYVLKALFAESKYAGARKETIDRAFYHATGGFSNTTQFAFWDAKIQQKEAWYANILESVRQEMNKNASSRKLMIQCAYLIVFGRMPTDGDMNYWMPRGENYKQLVEANRTWLYSPNGAKDLAETVTGVLKFNLNRTPTENEVKTAIGDYQKKRQVYMEMRGAMPAIYY